VNLGNAHHHAYTLALVATLGLAACADATPPLDLADGAGEPTDARFHLHARCVETECDVAVAQCLEDEATVEADAECEETCRGDGKNDPACEACLASAARDRCAARCDDAQPSPCAVHAFSPQLPPSDEALLRACVDHAKRSRPGDPAGAMREALRCIPRSAVQAPEMVDVYACLAHTPEATLEAPGACALEAPDPTVESGLCGRDAEECGSCDPERAHRVVVAYRRGSTSYRRGLALCYWGGFDCADRDRCLEAWLSVVE
jgi:hypothetical protein